MIQRKPCMQCKHFEVLITQTPCKGCVYVSNHPNWEATEPELQVIDEMFPCILIEVSL